MDEILDKIIDELIESDITSRDFKIVNEIIDKYRKDKNE